MKVRIVFRYIYRVSLSLIAAVVLYLLCAMVLSLIPTRPKAQTCASTMPFYVTSNGIHLDIIVPRTFFEGEQWEGIDVPDAIQYIAVGWGDKGFYLETPTWADLKLSTALKALFWKSETAMHLTYYHRVQSHWQKLELCPEQVHRLKAFLFHSFLKLDDAPLQVIPDAGYTKLDVFFEARGNYSIFRTCNNWANQALKAAQVKTAIWSPFDWGVLRHIERQP
ncbi:MAG: TIGR02117 family protein [Saprospiraceae bacterium]|nr:TIGR02117 family protein [Saprospiraceae bacterium]